MKTWLFNGNIGFGWADIKKDGGKLGPATYLYMNGRWPDVDYYNKEELAQLKQQGWEPSETSKNTRTKTKKQ